MFVLKILQFICAYSVTWVGLSIVMGLLEPIDVLGGLSGIILLLMFTIFVHGVYLGVNEKLIMSKVSIIGGIVVAFIGIMAMWFMGNYNSLVTAKLDVDNAWAQVETQYQRRFDLVDNLVASVKGGQKQEIEVFGKIAESRRMVASANSIDGKVEAMNQMETSIALLPRLQEAYPELKSNQLVQSLMAELAGTENGIATKRNNFNQVATNYNQNIAQFPKNMFASTFGFSKVSLFKSASGADKAVKVEL